MIWLVIGASFNLVGEVLIGVAVLIVHKHIMEEHKIDKDVFKQMKREQIYGILGVLFIIIGYLIHVFSL